VVVQIIRHAAVRLLVPGRDVRWAMYESDRSNRDTARKHRAE
jgi:hypothetical protein